MTREEDEVDAAVAKELRLLEPGVRRSPSLVRQLLDPDFVEVGASGKRWTYEDLPDELPEMDGATEDGPRCEPSDMAGVVLAPGLVHLTYESTLAGRRARRSSLWRRHGRDGQWLMYYHQATLVPPGET